MGNRPSVSFSVRASVSSRTVSGCSAKISHGKMSFARVRSSGARLNLFARYRWSAANLDGVEDSVSLRLLAGEIEAVRIRLKIEHGSEIEEFAGEYSIQIRIICSREK